MHILKHFFNILPLNEDQRNSTANHSAIGNRIISQLELELFIITRPRKGREKTFALNLDYSIIHLIGWKMVSLLQLVILLLFAKHTAPQTRKDETNFYYVLATQTFYATYIKRFMLCLTLVLLFCCTGKGSRVSFVLNQDFHSGYANENSTAFSILASNVKREVRCTVVPK